MRILLFLSLLSSFEVLSSNKSTCHFERGSLKLLSLSSCKEKKYCIGTLVCGKYKSNKVCKANKIGECPAPGKCIDESLAFSEETSNKSVRNFCPPLIKAVERKTVSCGLKDFDRDRPRHPIMKERIKYCRTEYITFAYATRELCIEPHKSKIQSYNKWLTSKKINENLLISEITKTKNSSKDIDISLKEFLAQIRVLEENKIPILNKKYEDTRRRLSNDLIIRDQLEVLLVNVSETIPRVYDTINTFFVRQNISIESIINRKKGRLIEIEKILLTNIRNEEKLELEKEKNLLKLEILQLNGIRPIAQRARKKYPNSNNGEAIKKVLIDIQNGKEEDLKDSTSELYINLTNALIQSQNGAQAAINAIQKISQSSEENIAISQDKKQKAQEVLNATKEDLAQKEETKKENEIKKKENLKHLAKLEEIKSNLPKLRNNIKKCNNDRSHYSCKKNSYKCYWKGGC